MTNNIKLLPLPEGYDKYSPPRLYDGQMFHEGQMRAYARANIAPLQAEIEALWQRGVIYQDGHVNDLFLAFRRGYAYSQADTRSDIQNIEASRDGYRDDAIVLYDALTRMVAMYEHEFDHEDTYKWRPDWLKSALARRNALRGSNHDNQD